MRHKYLTTPLCHFANIIAQKSYVNASVTILSQNQVLRSTGNRNRKIYLLEVNMTIFEDNLQHHILMNNDEVHLSWE